MCEKVVVCRCVTASVKFPSVYILMMFIYIVSVKVVINYFLWFHFKILHRSSFHRVDTDGKVINIYRTIHYTTGLLLQESHAFISQRYGNFLLAVSCEEECAEVHLQPKKNHIYGK